MSDIVVTTLFYIASIMLSSVFIRQAVLSLKKEKYFGFGLYVTGAIIYIIFIADMIFRG